MRVDEETLIIEDTDNLEVYPAPEGGFFLTEQRNIKYNEICTKCKWGCKQSHEALLVYCPQFEKKSKK